MRAFLALPLPPDTTGALLAAQALVPTGRPVPEDNLHLTLAFLGDVADPVLDALDDLLVSARLPAPEITFTGLGTFAEMEQALVFAEVQPNDRLGALQAKVASLARMAGADLPRRRFRPHVTLTRANRQPGGLARDQLAAALALRPDIPGFTAHAMTLYRSQLGPSGARHEALASYPLTPA